MLNIKILCVGKLKEQFYADAASEYIKRLSGYCKLEVLELVECRLPTGSSFLDPESVDKAASGQNALIKQALAKESITIINKIPTSAVIIPLCVEGREMDSYGLSEFLSNCALRCASRLCFIIGGSFGIHEDVKNRADLKLSMSKMTFPHNLARVMLLEQLYRAFKISDGGKYHK